MSTRAATNRLGNLHAEGTIILLQGGRPTFVWHRHRVKGNVAVVGCPAVLCGVIAPVRYAVNQLPVTFKAPLVAIERIFHAVKYKTVPSIGVADGAAAGGNHTVCGAGALHYAPYLVIGRGGYGIAVKINLNVGGITINGFHAGDNAAFCNGFVFIAGADRDHHARLNAGTLGNHHTGSIVSRGGNRNVSAVQAHTAIDLALRMARAVYNNHQIGQHLKVGTGANAVGIAPFAGRVQKLRDILAASRHGTGNAVQLAVRANAAGESTHIAFLLETAVRVQEFARGAVAGQHGHADGRRNVQHAGDIKQRDLHQHFAVGAILNVSRLALVRIDLNSAICVQGAAAAAHARPGVDGIKAVLPCAGISAGGKHKIFCRAHTGACTGAAGKVHTENGLTGYNASHLRGIIFGIICAFGGSSLAGFGRCGAAGRGCGLFACAACRSISPRLCRLCRALGGFSGCRTGGSVFLARGSSRCAVACSGRFAGCSAGGCACSVLAGFGSRLAFVCGGSTGAGLIGRVFRGSSVATCAGLRRFCRFCTLGCCICTALRFGSGLCSRFG